jgi:hypothetical protein
MAARTSLLTAALLAVAVRAADVAISVSVRGAETARLVADGPTLTDGLD